MLSDKAGITPLHSAAESGEENIIEYLVERGAIVNAVNEDNSGKAPSDLLNQREANSGRRHRSIDASNAVSGASKPSLLINTIAHTAVDPVAGLPAISTEQPKSLQHSVAVNVDSNLSLLNVIARLLTGKKEASHEKSLPKEEFTKEKVDNTHLQFIQA
ncbi:ankyrin repeat domain-containing protein [Wolbachia endosymbiont of Ctenocephalides felis wCfeT]|uniref:ankyrin repeat domain-containing protein n=1 Tax=Wolbachia endosymbiont of Ctenocephalides felis wCfeT TaxID=2732593 RepID=UPI001446DC6B|nr:ankyrin repeat domain-containing protein [Wolbachia endosymbiont of Ctenocephalides felis wCfeT]